MVISFAFSGIYYLALVRGIFTLLLVIFICVFCDVGGLTFGIRFGKHKFATTISPKKS
jgi:CDP-diglyceride synthetase